MDVAAAASAAAGGERGAKVTPFDLKRDDK
jgi:hypothetical protein